MQDWKDRSYTPGSWRYRPSSSLPSATFGTATLSSVSLTCDRAARRVTWWIAGAQAGPITVRTSYGNRVLPAAAVAGGAAASLTGTDPLLDRIAFSRGRIALAAVGVAELVLPAWAEPSRVIEDCRG